MRPTIAVLYLALLAATAEPATFLKVAGIRGDSTDPAHRDEIEVVSFQLTGKNLTITKRIDVASPQFFIHGASGKHIASVVLADGMGANARTYTFEDVVVTAFKQRVGSPTVEEVAFSFGKLKITTTEPSGSREVMKGSQPFEDVAAGSSVLSVNTGQTLTIVMTALPIPGQPVKSLSWEMRGGGGKAQFQPFEILKSLDEGSDRLFQSSQTRKPIPEVKLVLRQGGRDFFSYRLSDVELSDYSRTSNQERFKLQPARVEIQVQPPPGKSAAPKIHWDLKANKKV